MENSNRLSDKTNGNVLTARNVPATALSLEILGFSKSSRVISLYITIFYT